MEAIRCVEATEEEKSTKQDLDNRAALSLVMMGFSVLVFLQIWREEKVLCARRIIGRYLQNQHSSPILHRTLKSMEEYYVL